MAHQFKCAIQPTITSDALQATLSTLNKFYKFSHHQSINNHNIATVVFAKCSEISAENNK